MQSFGLANALVRVKDGESNGKNEQSNCVCCVRLDFQ
jgi:hypothetical protein